MAAESGGSTGRSDKSVQAFRDALEHSVTISRDRLQEIVDEAVERGGLSRDDANELIRSMVTRGRGVTDDLLRELERLVDHVRRAAGVGPSFPISDYDELTARQVTTKLSGLSTADLRQVRKREAAGKARKTVLAAIDKRLER